MSRIIILTLLALATGCTNAGGYAVHDGAEGELTFFALEGAYDLEWEVVSSDCTGGRTPAGRFSTQVHSAPMEDGRPSISMSHAPALGTGIDQHGGFGTYFASRAPNVITQGGVLVPDLTSTEEIEDLGPGHFVVHRRDEVLDPDYPVGSPEAEGCVVETRIELRLAEPALVEEG